MNGAAWDLHTLVKAVLTLGALTLFITAYAGALVVAARAGRKES